MEFGVKKMVFSSSATVYGNPEYLPVDEKHPTGRCTNPYGKTKYFMEEIIKDVSAANNVSLTSRDKANTSSIKAGHRCSSTKKLLESLGLERTLQFLSFRTSKAFKLIDELRLSCDK